MKVANSARISLLNIDIAFFFSFSYHGCSSTKAARSSRPGGGDFGWMLGRGSAPKPDRLRANRRVEEEAPTTSG